jgi:hypothetical protein
MTNETELEEMRLAAIAIQHALQRASGGPWCGQCGANFSGRQRHAVYEHILFVHQRRSAKALCRMFHWRWAVTPRDAKHYTRIR